MHEFYLDLSAFGAAKMFLGDAHGKGPVFFARALGVPGYPDKKDVDR